MKSKKKCENFDNYSRFCFRTQFFQIENGAIKKRIMLGDNIIKWQLDRQISSEMSEKRKKLVKQKEN